MAFSGNNFSGFSGVTEDQIALATGLYEWWEGNIPYEVSRYLSGLDYALYNISYYNIATWLPFFNNPGGYIMEGKDSFGEPWYWFEPRGEGVF